MPNVSSRNFRSCGAKCISWFGGRPRPDERLAYGPLTAQVIAPNRKPETIKYWLDHGSDVVAWIGAPKSQPSGVISDEQMADWIKEISEQVDRGCNGIFIDEFGGYPTEYGINRMRSIGVMLQQARERFPDLLIMPATAGAIQRELAIAYQEIGAVALLESYPTCFTRFFASHNFKKHLDWRIETARNTDLIYRVGKGQAAIVLLGTRVCGAHEEPVVAEVEHHVRYIKKTAPEMPGIGFYGDRYDGMTPQLVRMVNDYYIKPVVDLRAIRFAPYTAAAGKAVDVLVGIHNLGGMTARDIKVHVYAGEHGTAKKERIGTLSINAIGYGHRDLEPKQQGQQVEYQQVNGSRYAVIPNEQNRVFLARNHGQANVDSRAVWLLHDNGRGPTFRARSIYDSRWRRPGNAVSQIRGEWYARESNASLSGHVAGDLEISLRTRSFATLR